ncbi:unnamed protein product [Agarophyton chilense]
MCEKHTVQVGEVVAVATGKGRVDLARISAVSSSGDTVDITLLEEFVKEMYIESKQPPSYERVENIRPITSEYVPAQQGWIILNQDFQTAKNYFEQRAQNGVKQRTVEVTAPPPVQLSEESLKRQVFTPTRAQAFLAAALSLPLSALCYSAFAAARQTYQANPAGEDLLGGQVFRSLVLFATAGTSVSALVVGSALFLYGLSKSDQSDETT